MLKETCALLRHLILDDDVRIEFSKAHEHARTIAADVLVELTQLLPVYMKDKNILSELLLTIATLTVRHEFCVQVEETGGLKFINDCMVNKFPLRMTFKHRTDNEFMRNCNFLLKKSHISTERACKFNTCIEGGIEAGTCIGRK